MGAGTSKQQQEKGYRLAEVILRVLLGKIEKIDPDLQGRLADICKNYQDVCADKKSITYIRLTQAIVNLNTKLSIYQENKEIEKLKNKVVQVADTQKWTSGEIFNLTLELNQIGNLLEKQPKKYESQEIKERFQEIARKPTAKEQEAFAARMKELEAK